VPVSTLVLPAAGETNRCPGAILAGAPVPDTCGMRDIVLRGPDIRLGQLLKFAGIADSGGEAKDLLAAGEVRVNDEPEARRGRTLRDGDVVVVGEETLRIVGGPDVA